MNGRLSFLTRVSLFDRVEPGHHRVKDLPPVGIRLLHDNGWTSFLCSEKEDPGASSSLAESFERFSRLVRNQQAGYRIPGPEMLIK